MREPSDVCDRCHRPNAEPGHDVLANLDLREFRVDREQEIAIDMDLCDVCVIELQIWLERGPKRPKRR